MFRVVKQPESVGVLIAGLAGNNGSTLWALHKLNPSRILGSIISSADVPTGKGTTVNLSDLMQANSMLSNLGEIKQISGWDVKDISLLHALRTNNVVNESDILQLLNEYPEEIQKPIPKGIVYPNFIGLPGIEETTEGCVFKDVARIQNDINAFAKDHALDLVIVVYSGSTERRANNPPAAEFVSLLSSDKEQLDIKGEVSPSQIYAIATALAMPNTCFINCAAQDTFTPFIKELFKCHGRLFIGNDAMTGQTRLKSALLSTFLGNGIPVETIVNFNTLGNNDGLNLTNMETNRSKTQSKCAMVTGAMHNAPTLYTEQKMTLEQLVSISYLKSAGDNKRAMDEYTMLLPLGHKLLMFCNSVCPDTALAVGVIVDLILSVSLMSTIVLYKDNDDDPLFWKKMSSDKANALVACLVKNPQSTRARYSLFENRDVFTGFLLEACGQVSETFRHHSVLQKM